MDKRARRRRRKNAVREIADMVKTILLVVIAIFVVVFVYLFVTQQLGGGSEGSKISVFSSIFKRNNKDTEETAGTQESSLQEINTPNVTEGFNTDPQGRIYFIKNGELLTDCWLDHQSSLYRIDEDGFVRTLDYQEGAFVYRFSAKGEVTSITAAQNSIDQAAGTDTPGLVKSGNLMVYLNPDSTLGRFQQIQYKKTSVSHMLGQEGGAEYTLPGTIQIDNEGYVYWLPYVSDPDELEARINGTLFRMLPGSEERQFAARAVTGYRILTGENGKTVIYYCSQSTMYKCGSESCRTDNTAVGFTEDMEYRLRISDDAEKLYLETKSGYPVKKETTSFKTGGMDYSLSADGQVLTVKDQTHVTIGDYIYLVRSDELYGMKRSVVIRQKDEDKETISSEFTGECGNLYFSKDDGKIYAEYAFMDGLPRIVSITTDGDVDLLIASDPQAAGIRICGFDEENVIVKYIYSDGKERYCKIKKAESTPLAVSVEPAVIEETTAATQGPGEIISPAGPGGQSESTAYLEPGSHPTQAVPSYGPGGIVYPAEPTTGYEPGTPVIR